MTNPSVHCLKWSKPRRDGEYSVPSLLTIRNPSREGRISPMRVIGTLVKESKGGDLVSHFWGRSEEEFIIFASGKGQRIGILRIG